MQSFLNIFRLLHFRRKYFDSLMLFFVSSSLQSQQIMPKLKVTPSLIRVVLRNQSQDYRKVPQCTLENFLLVSFATRRLPGRGRRGNPKNNSANASQQIYHGAPRTVYHNTQDKQCALQKLKQCLVIVVIRITRPFLANHKVFKNLPTYLSAKGSLKLIKNCLSEPLFQHLLHK